MTLVINKKSSKKSPELQKESAYDKVKQQNINLRNKEKLAVVSKAKSDQIEKERIKVLVDNYLTNLDTQLREKESLSFWTFPDRSGFKKYKGKTVRDMQKLVSKDPQQYAGRHIAGFTMLSYHNEKSNSTYQKDDIKFILRIALIPIDKNGIINGKDNAWGLSLCWKSDDFKITKFSFKLLERILELVDRKEISGTTLTGIPLQYVLKDIKKLGYNFDDVLHPLAGI